jgi:hypothetical protein
MVQYLTGIFAVAGSIQWAVFPPKEMPTTRLMKVISASWVFMI